MRKQKIRVLFLNYADIDNYNAQNLNAREIALRLDPESFEVTLLVAGQPDSRLAEKSHIRLLFLPKRLGSVSMLWDSLLRQDILFSPSLALNFTGLYFRIPGLVRQRVRTIFWIEGEIKGNLEGASKRILEHFELLKRDVDTWIAITDYVAKTSLEHYGIDSQRVIPVGVNSSIFTPHMRNTSKPVKILFVGHFIQRKGVDLILELANVLREVEFHLVGKSRDGYESKLQMIAGNYQLTNVFFHEPMPQPRLARLMHESDLLVHPSKVEGMPKVVLEAAATGLPAIIFDEYQAPVIVDGTTGYQVKTFDEMLLRTRQLTENAELRLEMGQAAVDYVSRYSWDVLVRQWEQVLHAQV